MISALSVLLAGNACRRPEHPTVTPSKIEATSTAPATPPLAGPANPMRLYFVRADKVAVAGRKAAAATHVKEQALQALLAGPDEFEGGIGMSTSIPTGTRLLSLSIADGRVTVDLSQNFQSGDAKLPGVAMQLRVAEVVFTLTQFSDVHDVSITVDGKPLQGAGNLTRAELEAVTPKIFAESPIPGQSVTSPVPVTGAANVFEGTVAYSVNAPDGTELDHGFTTATDQAWGRWFHFSFTSSYTTQQHGVGHVILWEVSMKDGSHINIYDVPVTM